MQLPRVTQPRDRFYARAFTLFTVVALGVAAYRIVGPFFGPLVWAIFLAFLLHPLHVRLTRYLRDRPQWSAFALTMLVLILFIGPLTALSAAFAAQLGDLLHYVQGTLADQAKGNVLDLSNVPWIQQGLGWLDKFFGINEAQVRGWFEQGSRELLQSMASFGGKVFLGAIGGVVGFVLTLFMLFFFIRDGAQMFAATRELIPMSGTYKARLFTHLAAVTRAMVMGTGVTALIQGTLVGIAFLIVGLPSPLVFGVIAALASLLPFGGTALIWVPAAIVLGSQDRWGATIFMVLWGALLVSLVDNVVRPMLVSGRAQVGTLTVFIGVLGGISAFGAIGLFLGPVVLALIIALLQFMLEIRRLEVANAKSAQQPVATEKSPAAPPL
ncbi:MAG TPA: AI-2E family transporter [Steroidobacteraceae bacterium]|jgi:predicted PurR-regulated permease PerM